MARRPILERSLLAWTIALGIALVLGALVETGRLAPWTAALCYVGGGRLYLRIGQRVLAYDLRPGP